MSVAQNLSWAQRDRGPVSMEKSQEAVPLLSQLGFKQALPRSPPKHNATIHVPENTRIVNGLATILAQTRYGDCVPCVPSKPAGNRISALEKRARIVRTNLEARADLVNAYLTFAEVFDVPETPATTSYNPLQIIRNRKYTGVVAEESIWTIPTAEMINDFAWRQRNVHLMESQPALPAALPTPPLGAVPDIELELDTPSSGPESGADTADSRQDGRPGPGEHGEPGEQSRRALKPRAEPAIAPTLTLSGGALPTEDEEIEPLASPKRGSLTVPSFFGGGGSSMGSGVGSVSSFGSPGGSYSDLRRLSHTTTQLSDSSVFAGDKFGGPLISRLKTRYTDSSSGVSASDNDDEWATRPVFSRRASAYTDRHDSAASDALSVPFPSLAGGEAPTGPNSAPNGSGTPNGPNGSNRVSRRASFRDLKTKPVKGALDSDSEDEVDFPSDSERRREQVLHAQAELEYVISVFEVALRKKAFPARKLKNEHPLCDKWRELLNGDMVPQYLDYLSCIETKVVGDHRELEQDLAQRMDTLRTNTDRMGSEVATTLNRQLREVSARLDRLDTGAHTQCMYHLGYWLLEWSVVVLLRIIWVFATAALLVKKTLWFGLRFVYWLLEF